MHGKRFISVLMVCSILALVILAIPASAQEDVEKNPTCKCCGVERGAFLHSRVVVVYEDGTEVGTCSIHCAAIDNVQKLDAAPMSIRVGDHDTGKLIDGEKAFWVIGGKEPGVMTRRPKWAFETKEAAEKFVAAKGGDVTTFEEALRATYEDMYVDTKMIREKMKMRKMQSMEREQQPQKGK